MTYNTFQDEAEICRSTLSSGWTGTQAHLPSDGGKKFIKTFAFILSFSLPTGNISSNTPKSDFMI